MGKVLTIVAAVVLGIACQIALPATAPATTLSITGGEARLFRFDTSADVFGAGFSASQFAGTSNFQSGPFVGPSPVTFSFNLCCGGAIVRVGDLICTAPNDFVSGRCGTITVTNLEAVPTRPANFPSGEIFVSRVPFTASGHLNVGEGFDVVGQGLVIATFCGSNPSCSDGVSQPFLNYQFSVPEPSTLHLLAFAVGALGVCPQCRSRLRRRR